MTSWIFQHSKRISLLRLKLVSMGIILGGTLGEASSLEEEEKYQLIQNTRRLVGDKVPVILNVAETTNKAVIKTVQRVQENGAHGLMLLPPMRYKATDKESVVYFKEIANATGLPIIIYNNPVDYNIYVTLDMFEKLSDSTNIKGVKESSRDITNITKMRNRFGDRFKILSGVDTLGLESVLLGC